MIRVLGTLLGTGPLNTKIKFKSTFRNQNASLQNLEICDVEIQKYLFQNRNLARSAPKQAIRLRLLTYLLTYLITYLLT